MKRYILLFIAIAFLISVNGCATTHKSTTHGQSRDNALIFLGKTIIKGMTMEQVQTVAGTPIDATSYRYEEFDIKNGKKTITYVEQMPAWYYKTQDGEVEVLFKGGKVSRILVYEGL